MANYPNVQPTPSPGQQRPSRTGVDVRSFYRMPLGGHGSDKV